MKRSSQQMDSTTRCLETVLASFVILLTVTFGAPSADAQAFTVLHSYGYLNRGNGFFPAGTLELDPAGNLYGTTTGGGNCNIINGCGTVFKLDTTGGYNVLHFFNFTDGATPEAHLLRNTRGDLYGTTVHGGDQNCSAPFGCGTLFMLPAAGGFTVLHTFTGGTDGASPAAGVLQDKAGNLYGVTQAGGDPNCGCGTVFKLDASGQFIVLHSFTNTPDGAAPYSGLHRDAEGTLYGTTQNGGATGQGTVFKLDSAGKLTVLYNFTGGADGGNPRSSLLRDQSGNLYGTSYSGGSTGHGTVFKVSPSGHETVLHSFGTASVDGANPIRGLARDASGNFYGVTPWGGAAGGGIVYKLHSNGAFTVLYSFTGGTDGANPRAGVALDAAGVLYGSTFGSYNPAVNGLGVVFKITP